MGLGPRMTLSMKVSEGCVCDPVCRCSWENGLTVFTALNKDHVMCHEPRSQVQQPQIMLRELCLFKREVMLRGEGKMLIVLEARIWGHFKRSGG